MKSAIKECISNNILKGFLEQNTSEMINMLFQEFDIDKYIKVQKEEAEQKGLEKRRVEIARKLLDILDDKTITEKTGLSINDIIELRKGV